MPESKVSVPSLPSELQPFQYLTEKQVENLTGIKRQTLANQRSRGVGIQYSKVGSSIRYSLQTVLAFMEAHRVQREG